jgi:hypothetical protein
MTWHGSMCVLCVSVCVVLHTSMRTGGGLPATKSVRTVQSCSVFCSGIFLQRFSALPTQCEQQHGCLLLPHTISTAGGATAACLLVV